MATSMITSKPVSATIENIKVLLVGNDPIALGHTYDSLANLQEKWLELHTSFDVKDAWKKVVKYNPSCLVVDDTLNKKDLSALVQKVHDWKKSSVSITLLRSRSNRRLVLNNIQEYLIKEDVDPKRLLRGIQQAIKWKKAEQYLRVKYHKHSRGIQRLFQKS